MTGTSRSGEEYPCHILRLGSETFVEFLDRPVGTLLPTMVVTCPLLSPSFVDPLGSERGIPYNRDPPDHHRRTIRDFPPRPSTSFGPRSSSSPLDLLSSLPTSTRFLSYPLDVPRYCGRDCPNGRRRSNLNHGQRRISFRPRPCVYGGTPPTQRGPMNLVNRTPSRSRHPRSDSSVPLPTHLGRPSWWDSTQ